MQILPLLALFGVGLIELLLLGGCCFVPLVIGVVVFVLLQNKNGRDDRK